MKISKLAVSLLILCFMVGCSDSKSKKPKMGFEATEVTEKNYLSGTEFCKHYSEITKKESGRFVEVPLDYDNPAKGKLKIYAWTNKPFDPSLPSFIYLDGGPGGNFHGNPDFLDIPQNISSFNDYHSKWNQINMDQRGIGCSAPETYYRYKDPDTYSSVFTARDIEEVRKSFGIKQISVYGISYGTVPATIYGSLFPQATRAVVLEGVVNDYVDLDTEVYKAEKVNYILSQMSDGQKRAFAVLWDQESTREVFEFLIHRLVYLDRGFQRFQDILKEIIVSENEVNDAKITEYRKKIESYVSQRSKYPQAPGNTDDQVYASLFCKELGAFMATHYWYFDAYSLRFRTALYSDEPSFCKDLGLTIYSQKIYEARKFPLSVPVTYFQGSHDGATPATGAVKHWLTVPQAQSQFLLSARGGHNPIAQKMAAFHDDEESAQENFDRLQLAKAMQPGFDLALKGEPIPQSVINNMNQNLKKEDHWVSPTRDRAGVDLIKSLLQAVQAQMNP